MCAQPAFAAAHTDWTMFGWDVGRSSAPDVSMGITAANLKTLQRQQVRIFGGRQLGPRLPITLEYGDRLAENVLDRPLESGHAPLEQRGTVGERHIRFVAYRFAA